VDRAVLNERIQPDVELVTALDVDSITSGPFASPYMKEIMRAFGKAAFGRCSACAEFEDFVIGLARKLPGGDHRLGKIALEIGSFYGITAALLSQYFEEVIGVTRDRGEDIGMRDRIIAHLGIKNLRFVNAESNEHKARVINALKFDFCYQDGDHTNDTETDFALVRRCGRVLFHEYWPLQPAVWNLVNSLPQGEVTRARFDCLAYWERSGG
jgi:SAM-dependent methyltransferase